MIEGLKPCPWCKGINISVHPWCADYSAASCEGCKRTVVAADATAAWNALPRTVQAAPSDREKRLETALRFYANGDNYLYPDSDYGGDLPIHQDDGKIARAALADTTNNDGG